MIEIRSSIDVTDKIFDELRKYNDQFEPKVNFSRIAFYAEEDGNFVGGLEGQVAWDVLDISNMVVLKRNQGIGTQLLQKAEEYAKSQNLTKITAWTLDFQAPGFYKKSGFENFAVVPDFAGKHACHYFIKRI